MSCAPNAFEQHWIPCTVKRTDWPNKTPNTDAQNVHTGEHCVLRLTHHDLWDTKHVKSELATHALSEGKAFAYFLAVLGFDWVQFTVIRLSPPSGLINDWERADALFTLVLTIVGLVFLFLCNGGIRGKDFLYRYFPLSFVVGWKFMMFVYAALWCIGLVMQNAPIPIVSWTSTATLAAFNIAMFVRIGFHIREVARATQA